MEKPKQRNPFETATKPSSYEIEQKARAEFEAKFDGQNPFATPEQTKQINKEEAELKEQKRQEKLARSKADVYAAYEEQEISEKNEVGTLETELSAVEQANQNIKVELNPFEVRNVLKDLEKLGNSELNPIMELVRQIDPEAFDRLSQDQEQRQKEFEEFQEKAKAELGEVVQKIGEAKEFIKQIMDDIMPFPMSVFLEHTIEEIKQIAESDNEKFKNRPNFPIELLSQREQDLYKHYRKNDMWSRFKNFLGIKDKAVRSLEENITKDREKIDYAHQQRDRLLDVITTLTGRQDELESALQQGIENSLLEYVAKMKIQEEIREAMAEGHDKVDERNRR